MLAESVVEGSPVDRISVGRDGASDAISFLEAGVPAVEFGPSGAGHHGPEEWVSIESLARYRKALVDFVDSIGDSVAPPREARCRLTTPVRPGRALWKRYLIGTLLIVFAAATATSVAALNEVDEVIDAFQEGTGLDLSGELAEADVGKPQTIMLIGSDKRAKGARDYETGARSDTLILVRLDPDEEAHRAAVAAARPEGRDPRPRHRQAQRRLLARRPEADAEDRQAA